VAVHAVAGGGGGGTEASSTRGSPPPKFSRTLDTLWSIDSREI